jgi:hypothetical protein
MVSADVEDGMPFTNVSAAANDPRDASTRSNG